MTAHDSYRPNASWLNSGWGRHWEQQLQQIEAEGKRRRLKHFQRPVRATGRLVTNHQETANQDGPANRVDLINFGSNDYLGLSCHPEIIGIVQSFVAEYGWGSGASPLVTGRSEAHYLLEETIARFEDAEASLIFSTGYAANVAAIVTLVGKGDGIFSDQLNHASLIDGCRLSGAEICRYQHVSLQDLSEKLAQNRSRFVRAIIVTDSLFSMDGDLAPIQEICDLAERYDCLVVADEAHATGIYGAKGEGWCHATGCGHRVFVRTGTLSKAIGGLGGFLVGPQALIDLALHRGRAYMFSTSMPAVMAMASIKAFELLPALEKEREFLRYRGRELRQLLRMQGWQVGGDDSPIIPIYIGDPNLCLLFSQRLMEKGFYVPAIRPPTVPRDKSLLRLSLTTAHGVEVDRQFLEALADLGQEYGSDFCVKSAISERHA